MLASLQALSEIRMKTIRLLAVVSLLSLSATAAQSAEPWRTYEVTVTNITRGQQFTPLLVAAHRSSVRLFQLGQAASPELATLAEEGDVAPLKALLDANADVGATAVGAGLTDPGQSKTVRIETRRAFDRLSIAAMLIPTNDAFMALASFDLDDLERRMATVRVVAYDAGSERNDELCSSIPGPSFVECGGPGGGARIGGGEGFVHIHNGMHGIGSFDAAQRTWLNPVAEITIRRIR
jgi:hypothetical protein